MKRRETDRSWPRFWLRAVRPITTCNLSGFGLTKQWAAVKTLSLSIKVPPQNSSSNASPGLSLSKSLSENRQIEQNVGTGQLYQCQPVLGLLCPASAQAATLDQPRDRPLHYPSPRRVNPL